MEHFEKLFALLREWESLTSIRQLEISVQYNQLCDVPLLYLYEGDRLIYCLGTIDEAGDWISRVVRVRHEAAQQRREWESQLQMYQPKEV